MKIVFSPAGWEQYQHWRKTDSDICTKVDVLIAEIRRTPFSGIGKPEPLKGDKSGEWSRRINDEHRLVYRVYGKGSEQFLEVITCRFHNAKR